MSEFGDSALEWLREKVNAPVYAVFLISCVAWNHAAFYALFFEDRVPLGFATRYAYATSLLHSWHIYTNYPNFTFAVNTALAVVTWFAIPLALTYVAIWWLPYVHGIAHKKGLGFYFDRKLEFDRQRNIYEERKSERLQHLKVVVSEQLKTTEDIVATKEAQQVAEKSLSGAEQWEVEFQRLRKNPAEFDKLATLQKYAYSTRPLYDSERQIVSFLHVLDLFEFREDIRYIKLTEKGKFFIRRFVEVSGETNS